MKQDTIPAVSRAIQVLRLLQDHRAWTLHEISQRTKIPKPTLTRLLETLCREEVLQRDHAQKTYSAVVQLLSTTPDEADFQFQLDRTMENLCAESQETVEFYTPTPAGMVLVKRNEPKMREVRVAARLGFTRKWSGELEAVCQLGNGCFASEIPPGQTSSFWEYKPNLEHRVLSPTKAQKLINQARETEYATDRRMNPNGIIRHGAVVFQNEEPTGILTLAEFAIHSTDQRQDTLRTLLISSARRLSGRLSEEPITED